MADRSMKKPVGIRYNVLVKVASFIFPVDFVMINCEVDFQVLIILGRPFMAIRKTLIDLEIGYLMFILRTNR